MAENLSRRDFLRRSGQAAVGMGLGLAAIPGGAPGEKVLGANGKIVLGLIGCGGRGRAVLGNHMRHPEVAVAAVCDVDEAHMKQTAAEIKKKLGKEPQQVKDYRKLLGIKDIDAVIVGTPDHWHALTTVNACDAGKDVYVEKPISHNIAEGRAMVSAARRNKRVVQVGTQQRSEGPFFKAITAIKQGRIGEVSEVLINFHGNELPNGLGNPPDEDPPPGVDYDLWLGPAPKRPFNRNRFHRQWRSFFDYGSGKIGDWGIHHIDIVHWAMDPTGGYEIAPIIASGTGGKWILPDNRDTPDTQETIFQYPAIGKNPPFIMTVSVRFCNARAGGDGNYGINFYGSKGTLYVDRGRLEVWGEKGNKIELDDVKAGGGHARNFLDCIKSRKNPISDIEIGHRSTTIPHLGNIAMRVGRTIHWDANNEKILGDAEASRFLSRAYRPPWVFPSY